MKSRIDFTCTKHNLCKVVQAPCTKSFIRKAQPPNHSINNHNDLPYNTQQPAPSSNTVSDRQPSRHHSIGAHSHFSAPCPPALSLPFTSPPLSPPHYRTMASTGVNVRPPPVYKVLMFSSPPPLPVHSRLALPNQTPPPTNSHLRLINTPHRSSATQP